MNKATKNRDEDHVLVALRRDLRRRVKSAAAKKDVRMRDELNRIVDEATKDDDAANGLSERQQR